MINRNKFFYILGAVLLTQAYQNCGGAQSFTVKGDAGVATAMSSLSADAPQVAVPADVSTATETTDQSTVSTVTAPTTTTSAQTIKTTYDYSLSFGQISDAMKGPLNTAIGSLVRNTNCNTVSTGQYNCGEIPFGTIVDANRKLISTMDLGADLEGSEGKESYKFKSVTDASVLARIYMDRVQRPGSVSLNYLPFEKTQTVATSAGLGDDVFFRLSPLGGSLDTQVCTMIPGIRVLIDDINLKGEARKSDALPFGIDAVATGTVVIHPGELNFDHAYVCADLRMQMVQGVPQLSLQSTGPVTFEQATFSGLWIEKNLKVKGILGFFDRTFDLGVTDQFKTAVQNKITAEVQKQVNIGTAQMQNGAYISGYLDTAHLAPLIDKLNTQISQSFTSGGFISTQIQNVSQAACVSALAKTGLDSTSLAQLGKLCASAVQVQMTGFYADPAVSLDCFAGSFDPRLGTSLGGTNWWRESCGVIIRTSAILDLRLQPAMTCLLKAWTARQSPATLCLDQITSLTSQYSQGQLNDLLASLAKIPAPNLTADQIQQIQNLIVTRLGDTLPSADLINTILNH